MYIRKVGVTGKKNAQKKDQIKKKIRRLSAQ